MVLKMPCHLENLEKLFPAGQDFFTKIGPTAGDFAIFGALNILLDLQGTILERFPKLTGFYNRIASMPSLQRFLDNPPKPYFKWVVAEPVPEVKAAGGQRNAGSSMPTTDYGPGIAGRKIIQAPGGTSSVQFFG